MCKEKGITTGIFIMCRLVPGTGAEWKERAAMYLFECFQVLFIYNDSVLRCGGAVVRTVTLQYSYSRCTSFDVVIPGSRNPFQTVNFNCSIQKKKLNLEHACISSLRRAR